MTIRKDKEQTSPQVLILQLPSFKVWIGTTLITHSVFSRQLRKTHLLPNFQCFFVSEESPLKKYPVSFCLLSWGFLLLIVIYGFSIVCRNVMGNLTNSDFEGPPLGRDILCVWEWESSVWVQQKYATWQQSGAQSSFLLLTSFKLPATVDVEVKDRTAFVASQPPWQIWSTTRCTLDHCLEQCWRAGLGWGRAIGRLPGNVGNPMP